MRATQLLKGCFILFVFQDRKNRYNVLHKLSKLKLYTKTKFNEFFFLLAKNLHFKVNMLGICVDDCF